MLTITKKLDMSPHGVPQVIRVSQYDSDFTLEFKLFASGGNFAISTGTTAEIRGTKQSGTGYSASATLDTSNKIVTVTGAAQMTAVAGMNIFEIVLKKNNKEISSANFCLMVERAALDAGTITDESVLKELNAIIESADTATQAAEEAEAAADRAEAAAQTLVIDPTLTLPGQPADAKVVGDKLAPLIGGDEQREITGWVHSKYINVATPNIGDTVDITNISSFYSLKYVIVNCEAGDKFLLDLQGAGSARAWAFLTSSNVLISRADASVTLTDVTITAPQNAGKAIFQCIYRQSPDDVTTDNGKAYKIVSGSGNVVRFDIVQDKTEEEKARARENIGITSSGEGLSEDVKAALLACFEHVAWVDEHGQDYYDALEGALYGITPSENINVTFNANGRTFYTDDPIESLKNYLTVTYDGTATNDYELVGTLSGNNIRVKIGNEYSNIIPITAESPKYVYSTTDGGLSIINGTIDYSATPAPGVDTSVSNTRVVATSKGRQAFTNSNGLYPIPVPADCTNVTIDIKPHSSNSLEYAFVLYRFAPNNNTSYFVSQVVNKFNVQTFPLEKRDLREIALIIYTLSTAIESCTVTFS